MEYSSCTASHHTLSPRPCRPTTSHARSNPVGQSRLREVFLKTDNHIGGRYLAELTREVFEDLESSKCVAPLARAHEPHSTQCTLDVFD